MIKKNHAISNNKRVVIWQRNDSCPKLNVFGSLCCRCDKYVRCSYGFPAATVMLSNPRLVISKFIEPLDQFKVTLKG
jgi:hypothetical protein